ncbi:diphthamide biosynthesis protein [Methanocaldococcus infernus ME]|uniref:2-(3-amino-3-carboxypropyl)histidine synthase n=1 Tax=Methanocaldococcus infernus (strain DSM 11812 / JCM 15783 / ME) TaxID=573063 RepID=D5VRR2_METIM|nr:diphthamide biosynthesis enzyme Dph2 [Methanocaldococcus infernus]ADG13265.1 diphthamide biosynthesis protein [Methanocaldococcus infernus ME]
MYNLEREKVIEKIVKLNKKKPLILFQAPEGLKLEVQREIEKIDKELKKRGIEGDLFLWLNSCYGACDIPKVDADLIIHYGHKPLSYLSYKKVLFIPAYFSCSEEEEAKIKEDVKKFVEKGYEVVTTVQYEKLLKEFNPKVILGCRGKVEGDKILYVGTGRFHPLMIAYKYGVEVLIYNPYSKRLEKISKEEIEKFIKRRLAKISKALLKPIKKVGLILSVKPGQCRINVLKALEEELKKRNIEYIKFLADEIKPELLFYDVDLYVIIACPRIVLDDFELYDKIIVTPEEFKMILNKDFSYKFDEIKEEDF